jgi:hypothetical protein
MKKILLFMLFGNFYLNAQETVFTFTVDKGMTDFIVTPIQSKTSSEIYAKIVDWIKLTYKNPNIVILSTYEKDFVRFEGFSETLYSGFPTKYEIELSIKDGKYKFDLLSLQSQLSSNSSTADSWIDIPLFYLPMSQEDFKKKYVFKKDGTLANSYKFAKEIPTYFNNLNKSLYESIVSENK